MAVILRPVEVTDQRDFLASVQASRSLHERWVTPPSSAEKFADYYAQMQQPNSFGWLVCESSARKESLAGVINLTNVVFGNFCSGYLGYYAFVPAAGRGVMTKGLQLAARHAFRELGLHRLEANIQPQNKASIKLAKRCGFQREGMSPRYLKLRGRWRDHERWALVRD